MLCSEARGGRGDTYKEWHFIWRRGHVCWSCCAEPLRANLRYPRGWLRSPHLSDYMSRPVSLAKLAWSCRGGEHPAASNFSFPVIKQTVFCFLPVRLCVITKDCKRLLVSVCTHKCGSADERMWRAPFLFAFRLRQLVSEWKQGCLFLIRSSTPLSFFM